MKKIFSAVLAFVFVLGIGFAITSHTANAAETWDCVICSISYPEEPEDCAHFTDVPLGWEGPCLIINGDCTEKGDLCQA